MKGKKSKWIRYFNIILGIPNKKGKRSANHNLFTERSTEPASRQIDLLRDEKSYNAWQLKADYNGTAVIQHCESDF